MFVDLGQPAIAAAVAGGIFLLVANVLTTGANALVAWRKFREDRELALSQKAWADYELRRDAYLEIARLIDSLHDGGNQADRSEYLRAVRKLWIVGSDDVVRAANALSDNIVAGKSANDLAERYDALFNAMRGDIRQRRAVPAEGTQLGSGSFPIRGPGYKLSSSTLG
jgi:alkyl hydroperoxide reductase subunit AhpC